MDVDTRSPQADREDVRPHVDTRRARPEGEDVRPQPHVDILAAGDCPHCQRIRAEVEERFRDRGPCCSVDTHRHPEALGRFGLEMSPVVVVDGRVYAGEEDIRRLLSEAGARLA